MAAGKKQSDKDAMAVINEHIKNESYAPVYLLLSLIHISEPTRPY